MALVDLLDRCADHPPASSRLANRPDLLDLIASAATFGPRVQRVLRKPVSEWGRDEMLNAVSELSRTVRFLAKVLAADRVPYAKLVADHLPYKARAIKLLDTSLVLFNTEAYGEAAHVSGLEGITEEKRPVKLSEDEVDKELFLAGRDGLADVAAYWKLAGPPGEPSHWSIDERIEELRGLNENPDRCDACLAKGPAMACSKCKIVRYCSDGCQRKDWKEHKQSCQAIDRTPWTGLLSERQEDGSVQLDRHQLSPVTSCPMFSATCAAPTTWFFPIAPPLPSFPAAPAASPSLARASSASRAARSSPSSSSLAAQFQMMKPMTYSPATVAPAERKKVPTVWMLRVDARA